MSRARDLSRFVNPSAISIGTTFNVGINSTVPDVKLDVSGIVTATSFHGSGAGLTGVTAESATTASGLSGNPTISITNLTGAAGTFSGIVDITNATDSISTTTGALIVRGGLAVGKNVNIAGTVTFEDVTNIDAIGFITATQGIHLGLAGIGGTLNPNGDTTLAGVVTAPGFSGSGANLTNTVGVQSGGVAIGTARLLNFVGVGNTVVVSGDTIDISISSGGAKGGGTDRVFFENQTVVNNDYELTSGFSAMSVGPVSVSAGVTVTVPVNRRWVIL